MGCKKWPGAKPIQNINTTKGINAAIAQPAVAEKLQNVGLVVVSESPQYFEKILRADFERYGQIVKAIGYQPQ